MGEITRFDDALPILVEVILGSLGRAELCAGTVLRDSQGRVAFFLSAAIAKRRKTDLAKTLAARLGHYARADRLLVEPSEFGWSEVAADRFPLKVAVLGCAVRLVDRRIVGADWMRSPAEPDDGPLRIAFASIKGGVGRSTALSVVAAHLAGLGRRVLAVDMDLEAPGIGAMLLREDTLPEFGMLDALVENGVGGLDDQFVSDMIGPSHLSAGKGRIDVVPAFGRRSLHSPGEILAKLARAYSEDVRGEKVLSLIDQLREIVSIIASSSRYDVVLIDSRAGLHESSAATILGMGAEMFLFGLNERQTIDGYRALLSHVGRLRGANVSTDAWLSRVVFVQSRANSHVELSDYEEQIRAVLVEASLVQSPPPAGEVHVPAEPFGDVPWDDSVSDDALFTVSEAGFSFLQVREDPRFRLFSPIRSSEVLSDDVYRSSFGELVSYVERLVSAAELDR